MAGGMRQLAILIGGSALAVTVVLASALPSGQSSAHHASLRAAFTALGAAATLPIVGLFAARFRDRALQSDLCLACFLAVFALGEIVFDAFPAALDEVKGSAFWLWSPLTAALAAATLLVAAALAPRVPVRGPEVTAAGYPALALVLLAGATGIAAVASSDDPGAAGILEAKFVAAAILAAAGVALAARALRARDEVVGWIALASVLAGAAWLDRGIFPSDSRAYLHSGDFLTLGACLVLLIAAAREWPRHTQRLQQKALLSERRRMARDLHDGLAQELAFIATQTRLLVSSRSADPELTQVAAASERALDESRNAISALTRLGDEPISAALPRAVEDVADRVGTAIELDVDADVQVEPAAGEALIRIAREAVSNAARHGAARTVRVELHQGDRVVLRISDDGHGFDPEKATSNGGFGLVSMRERAQALGGELSVRSREGFGSEIEVVVP
jgi:signal transduction histidine kinase